MFGSKSIKFHEPQCVKKLNQGEPPAGFSANRSGKFLQIKRLKFAYFSYREEAAKLEGQDNHAQAVDVPLLFVRKTVRGELDFHT